MTVLCPKCRRAIRVPPDKQDVPDQKTRCGGCGTVFAVAEASLALVPASEAPPRATPPPAAPAPAPAPAQASRPAAALPRPVTPAPATPRPAAEGVARPSAPASRPARPGGGAWRRCASHSSTPSQGICSQCGKGWCVDCLKSQGSAMICPSCDALCLPAAEQEAKEAKARMRARPLMDELGTVLGYPLSDKMAFLVLAVVVGVFSVAASLAVFGAGLAILLSQGLLFAYAFTAINRVSAGQLDNFMPNIGDLSDLVEPMRVGLAALLISTGPLLVLVFLHPPSEVLGAMGLSGPAALTGEPTPGPQPSLAPEVQALLEEQAAAEEEGAELEGDEASGGEQAPGEFGAGREAYDEPGVPVWVFAAYLLAILWKVFYSPVALVVGAISRGFLATLNPLAGIGAIKDMGGTYWSAMGIYTAIAAGETVLIALLSLIPLAGRFLGAFVQSYTYLAIGCLLGLAVYKKAPELGLE